MKSTRVALSSRLIGPDRSPTLPAKQAVLKTLSHALLVSRTLAFVQGFHLIAEASRQRQWHIPLHTVASVWQAGCILRGELLKPIEAAFAQAPDDLLLTHPPIEQTLNRHQLDLRQTVQWAHSFGVAVPCMSSALDHWDSMRTAVSSARLIQAQRDYFGAHTYERIDRPGFFHTDWHPASD